MKRTLLEIKKLLRNINSNIFIISSSYENNKTHLQCGCDVCGYTWKAPWIRLQTGRGCRKCTDKIRGKNKRLTIPYINEQLTTLHPSLSLLSAEYINNFSPLRWKCCICLYEWSSSWQHLNGCKVCSGRLITIESAQKRISALNPNALVDSQYQTSHKPLPLLHILRDDILSICLIHLSRNYGV